MRMLVLLLILLLSIISLDPTSHVQAASGASIPTEGGTWTNSQITIVIFPQLGQSWFKASYSSDVSRAITRWTESILAYTDAYGSNYLRKLGFLTYIAGVNQSIPANPDIQVEFILSFGSFGPQSEGLGLTDLRISKSTAIFQAPTTTTLAAYDPTNTTQLSDVDMVNIASHEFGHALGLDHATAPVTDDGSFELMYKAYEQAVGSPANSLEAPSTLDLFALSQIYFWLASSSTLTGSGLAATDVSLPAAVAYKSVYPFAEQIQMLQDSISRLKLEIIILAVIVALLLAGLIALGILVLRKKPAPTPPPFFGEPVSTPPVGEALQYG